MFSRRTASIWIGIILLSGMFLMGQDAWSPPCDEVVEVPDPTLEMLLRLESRKYEGDICASDLRDLTYLDNELCPGGFCVTMTISDLTGLEYCSGLTELHLSGDFSDLSPLAVLDNLTVLSLGSTQLSDITPLAGLTAITTLGLHNQISDITPLAGMTAITWLDLTHNQISDITPLAGMTAITWLALTHNQTSDIYPLVQNSGLGTGDHVFLSSNPLEDTSCTTYIPELESRGVVVSHDCP